jgi:hypothetical protein
MKAITKFRTTLVQSMTTSSSAIEVLSILTPDGHTLTMDDFGTTGYIVLEPNTIRMEIVAFTGITGSSFTGLTRGLAFYGTDTSSVTANKKVHPFGCEVAITNVHYFYIDNGDVTGPLSATDEDIAVFDTATGKKIKDSGVKLSTKANLDNPTFTTKVTTPAIKITTGAGANKVLTSDGSGDATWETPSVGSGTVTKVSVVTADGISGTVATDTTTPAITLALGNIVPTTVNELTLAKQAVGFTVAGGTTSKTLTVPLDASVSGTNTGDNTVATAITGTPDITVGKVTTTGNIELGHASDTTLSRTGAGAIAVEGVAVPTISSTSTLTNKRITKRVGSTTSHATPTINTDNVDEYGLTAQAEAITNMSTNLSGTPTDGQTLLIRITGTGARGITWGTSFASGDVTLPTTTTGTKTLLVGFKIINAVSTTVWQCIASTNIGA